MRRWVLLGLAASLEVSCLSPRLVPLQAREVPADTGASPFKVIATIDHARDPLPVEGDSLEFSNVSSTLGEVIALATGGWADRHRAQRPGGWELRVELIQSRAEESQGQITVELATRVTLSAIVGQVYLAQTHGYCRHTDPLSSPSTHAVDACMEGMARDLAGWLEGVPP